jgi:hypothetical protein
MSHIPSGTSLGVVLLDHLADLGLIFSEASVLFPGVAVQAYIPISTV